MLLPIFLRYKIIYKENIMIKIPVIDPSTRIINVALQPYFKQIANEVRPLNTMRKHTVLHSYKRYLEHEAQMTRSVALRMQLRINLVALLEQFDYNGSVSEGYTVLPKHMGLQYEI